MKPEGLVQLIRQANLFDIFIISFFVLPIAAAQWIKVLQALNLDIAVGLVVMVGCYVGAVALLMWGANRSKRRDRARDLVLGYLHAKGFEMVSFDRIRQRIDATYADPFLTSLVDHYPRVFRHATLSGKRPGLARLDFSDTQEQLDA